MNQPEVAEPTEVGETAKSNKNLKAHRPEAWEINAIGDFLLNLYHKQQISAHNDWVAPKDFVRQEFAKFLRTPGNELFQKAFIELNGTADIGTLLFRTRYLINTQRGSAFYRVRKENLYEHRDRKLDEYDKKRRNDIGDGDKVFSADGDNDIAPTNLPNVLQNKIADNEKDEENNLLHYQGSELQLRKSEFSQEKLGCFVCQINFKTKFEYEEHVVFHSEESNFKLLESLKKFDTSIFKISYKTYKNSQILCFTLETRLPNVIVEKIMLVQSRSFHYLNDLRVPYKINGTDTFYINSQFFTEFLEYPIIILFHTTIGEMRLMEQHHFVRYEPFPVVQLLLNPQHLSDESQFEALTLLSDYEPDVDLLKSLKDNFPTEYLMKIRPEFYEYIAENKKVNLQNIRSVFKMLLQMEDLAVKRANYLLLQREVNLRQCGEIYSLKLKYLWWSPEIPGGGLQHLPEPNDEVILLQESTELIIIKNSDIFQYLLEQKFEEILERYFEKENTYTGRIMRVVEGRILFESEQKIPLDKSFVVIIRPIRLFLRHQQRALESIATMSLSMTKFLFPQNVKSSLLPLDLPSNNLALQNEGIKNDDEQLQAVRNIVADTKMDSPYIITGGPGTGKTTVIVESILQLYLRRSETKILVVAGTDSACDEIALRLCKVLCKMHDSNAIARIYEYPCKQRREKIDELLLEYSNLFGKKYFIPSANVLHGFRILVCTTKLIGRLSLGRFGKTAEGEGVYTHVFVDDAAGITEPEILISMVNILSPHSKFILSGDVHQLDPLLYSIRAKELGLSVSLMERLLSSDCYSTDEEGNYNRLLLTKLMRNYRAHPKIVGLYNHLYYENKMISVASDDIVSLYRSWHRIPNPNYPVIFYDVNFASGVNDVETNDSSCMSTYNFQELEVILKYVKDLMYNGMYKERKIAQNEIGIITPYKKQALRIEDELKLRGWYRIDVGLPEDFQGKEKSIIFVSFVWASPTTLDILDNSRRLNFMISRAKSLLILIGNSKVLNQSKDFKYLIDECRKNKSLEYENLFWREPKFQTSLNHSSSTNNLINDEKCGNNDDDEPRNEDGDDSNDNDDVVSQCSEVNDTGAKKKNRKRYNRKNKRGNGKLGSMENDTTSTNATQNRNENKGDGKAPSIQQSNNEPKQNKQKAKNQKQNTNNNNKANNASTVPNPIDELLKGLPNVPEIDPQTLNVKNMEADIQERLRKLNMKSTSSTAKAAATVTDVGVDVAIVDKNIVSCSFAKKNNKNTATQDQQIKVQQQLMHGNSAIGHGHGHVKRLTNNNQQLHSGQQRSNNPNKSTSANKNVGGTQRNQQQKLQQQKQQHQKPKQQALQKTHQNYQQQPPPMAMPYPYMQQTMQTPFFQQQTPQQHQVSYPQQQFYQMPPPSLQSQPCPRPRLPSLQSEPRQRPSPPSLQSQTFQRTPTSPPPAPREPPQQLQPQSPTRQIQNFHFQNQQGRESRKSIPNTKTKPEDKCVIA